MRINIIHTETIHENSIKMFDTNYTCNSCFLLCALTERAVRREQENVL